MVEIEDVCLVITCTNRLADGYDFLPESTIENLSWTIEWFKKFPGTILPHS
jgi:hypothetical protein